MADPSNELETSCVSSNNNESITTFSSATNPNPPPPLVVSGSFKESKSSSRRRPSRRPSLDADDFLNLLHGSDPVKVELNRLENEVRGYNLHFYDFILPFLFWVFHV